MGERESGLRCDRDTSEETLRDRPDGMEPFDERCLSASEPDRFPSPLPSNGSTPLLKRDGEVVFRQSPVRRRRVELLPDEVGDRSIRLLPKSVCPDKLDEGDRRFCN